MIGQQSMSSSSTQLYASRMGIYEPFHQINSWPNAFGSRLDTSISPITKVDDCVDNKPEFVPFESMDHLESSQEMNKPIDDKVQRRLAQNREAARKSRMRKKVYVQQLETSRLKLAQLEEELERTRQQKGNGCLVDTSHIGFSGLVNPGIAAFEMEYNHWVEEQQRQINELRKALQVHTTDIELQILVESSLNHYHNLFCMKAKVAKADVFYLMSGVWRSSAERFFLWIGGFRPSELLNVLKPYLEPLNEQQRADIHKLQQSSRQAEDALTQGMEKLHQNLSLSIAGDPIGSYISQMGDGMEKFEALESFISQLDAAAPQLARLKEPIVLAKVNADKYTSLAKKYDVDAYPTIKIFMHGVPVDYYGPRKAELLARYLKKFVAPDVSVLESDSSINEFVEAAGPYFPIYLGFGLDESVISKFGIKYKKKAWFSVAKGFSEDIMVSYDFDKVPALVSIHPNYNNERSIFYGPFEEQFLEEFIKQSLFPLVLPINYDTLKLLKDDDRKIALTIVEDEDEDQTKKLINLLKAAASANRDLVFAYVGAKQWGEFADSFGDKKTTLPKMVIWDGEDDYLMVTGSETIVGNDHASEISKFIEGYREGRTEKRRVAGPAILGFINSLIGIRTIYIIVIIVAGIMLYQNLTKDDSEYPRVDTSARDQVEQTSSSSAPEVERSEYKAGDKED